MPASTSRPFAAAVAALCAQGVAIVAAQAPSNTVPSLLIRSVTLVDGNGGAPRAGANVLLRDGRVSSVTATADDEAVLTLDGRGLFLLPGLTDAHVHLSGMPWAERSAQLTRVLQGGVTMVYDVASDFRKHERPGARRDGRRDRIAHGPLRRALRRARVLHRSAGGRHLARVLSR